MINTFSMRSRYSCLAGILISCFIPVTLWSQYLVSSESLGSRSKSELAAQFGITVRTGVSLYKLHYITTDVHGNPDTASGLLVFPEVSINNAMPMVIYQHGTTNGPADVPSRLAAGSTESLAYGSMGYVTLAADYLGLGDNSGFHPYVHAATEASSAIDMLFAVTEWIEVNTGSGWIGDLFVAGYSQGGHAAAAVQKELEDNWSLVYPVTASTPMSGPYSLSGVMFSRIVSDEIYYTPAYLAYIFLSYQEVYGNLYNDLTDVFKPAYVPAMESFRDGLISTTLLNILLANQLFLEAGVSKPKLMFRDSVLQEIVSNPDHPIRVDLRDNDLYDWTPQVPTRLYYCTADEQVPYQNSIVADSAMQANGAPNEAAIDIGALSHGDCASPAIRSSIAFFDSFLIPNAVEAPPQIWDTAIAASPASGSLKIFSGFSDITDFTLINLAGQRTPLSSKYSEIDISDVSSGVYVLQATRDGAICKQKIVIIN